MSWPANYLAYLLVCIEYNSQFKQENSATLWGWKITFNCVLALEDQLKVFDHDKSNK